MYTNNVINNISDDIPNGTTKRTDCPNCGGRNTFTITNNMGSLLLQVVVRWLLLLRTV